MEPQKPKKMRPSRPSGKALSVRVDGDMLLSMHGHAQKPPILTPTATVGDYEAATETMVAHNHNKLEARLNSNGVAQWDDGCGVWRLTLSCAEDTALSGQMVNEFRDLFQDGVLSLKAARETDYEQIQGGWLKPYQNTLSRDEADQKKSVLAIPARSFTKVKAAMPFLNDVVVYVKDALLKEFKNDGGRNNLKAVEYTFFCGTYPASCTKWHRDTAEHPSDDLVFTTLTLFAGEDTSMCIAGKDETWLKKPFDTVCFDPDLFHRSGQTFEHVVKLSIHWREVRTGPKEPEQGGGSTSADAPSSPTVKTEVVDSVEPENPAPPPAPEVAEEAGASEVEGGDGGRAPEQSA